MGMQLATILPRLFVSVVQFHHIIAIKKCFQTDALYAKKSGQGDTKTLGVDNWRLEVVERCMNKP